MKNANRFQATTVFSIRILGVLSLCWFISLPAFAQVESQDRVPTYSKNVASILNEKCVSCHNPNGIGPMSLRTYDEVKPFSPLIMLKVQARVMPPWHLDKTIGIQKYKNDTSLSDLEIETIVNWFKAGSPEGDRALLPEPPAIPTEDVWTLVEELGEPDFVVQSPPYDVTANGQDQWWVQGTPFKGYIDEPRYVRATEMKGSFPLGVKVLHHGHATLVSNSVNGQRSMQPLGRQGVGKGGDLFPEGTGMLIQPEGEVRWNLHYFPIDQVVLEEQTEAAVWLYPKGYVPEFQTLGERKFDADGGAGTDFNWAADLLIPPNTKKAMQGTHVLQQPALITSFRPHMHMRGTEQSLEAILPTGERLMLSRVDKYNHSWQISYEFADDSAPLLPKGTVLLITTTWDNTANNPNNPDPRQWVSFGQRGVDEMSHTWLGMTYLEQEQYEDLLHKRSTLIAGKESGE